VPKTAFRPAWTSSTTELLTVGRVTKAHGLRGEVIVQLWTELTERLDPGSTLITRRGPLTVEAARPFQDRWIVLFDGYYDRTQAETLRGVELEAEAIDVPGALFVHELVGATVRDIHGTPLGSVTAVEANPASDLLVLESGGLIPLRFMTEHDQPNGTIVVDIPEGLLDP
jgi:16S rRNA processing protein RimM